MTEKANTQRFDRWLRILNWVGALTILGVLASCVEEIDGVGGGHDATKKMAGVFFVHLFLLVPCLLGLYVLLRLKLEKLFLSREYIEQLNQAHMAGITKKFGWLLGRKDK